MTPVWRSFGQDRVERLGLVLASLLALPYFAPIVEEDAQLEVLKRLDCDFAQGYLFGAPLWPEQLRTSLPSALVEPR